MESVHPSSTMATQSPTNYGPVRHGRVYSRNKTRDERRQKRDICVREYLQRVCHVWHPQNKSWLPQEAYHEPSVDRLLREVERGTGISLSPQALSSIIRAMWKSEGATAEELNKLRRHNRPREYFGIELKTSRTTHKHESKNMATQMISDTVPSLTIVHRGVWKPKVHFSVVPTGGEGRLIFLLQLQLGQNRIWPVCKMDATVAKLELKSDNKEVDTTIFWPQHTVLDGNLRMCVRSTALFIMATCLTQNGHQLSINSDRSSPPTSNSQHELSSESSRTTETALAGTRDNPL